MCTRKGLTNCRLGTRLPRFTGQNAFVQVDCASCSWGSIVFFFPLYGNRTGEVTGQSAGRPLIVSGMWGMASSNASPFPLVPYPLASYQIEMVFRLSAHCGHCFGMIFIEIVYSILSKTSFSPFHILFFVCNRDGYWICTHTNAFHHIHRDGGTATGYFCHKLSRKQGAGNKTPEKKPDSCCITTRCLLTRTCKFCWPLFALVFLNQQLILHLSLILMATCCLILPASFPLAHRAS